MSRTVKKRAAVRTRPSVSYHCVDGVWVSTVPAWLLRRQERWRRKMRAALRWPPKAWFKLGAPSPAESKSSRAVSTGPLSAEPRGRAAQPAGED